MIVSHLVFRHVRGFSKLLIEPVHCVDSVDLLAENLVQSCLDATCKTLSKRWLGWDRLHLSRKRGSQLLFFVYGLVSILPVNL